MVPEGQTDWELTERLPAADRRGDEIVCQSYRLDVKHGGKKCSDHDKRAPM